MARVPLEREAVPGDTGALVALEGREVRFAAEPVAEINPGAGMRVVYHEILLRPGLGMDPAGFVAAAAALGVGLSLDKYVIAQAAALAARTGWCCGVNISRTSASGWTALAHALSRMGEAAERMVLEITESGPDDGHTGARLRVLCREAEALGCRVALDDAGAGAHTGAGFLRALEDLRPHYVKLDRSLLARPRTFREHAMAARSAGAVVVAEGIETPDQASWAIAHGASCLQGRHVERALGAMPASAE